MRLKLGCCEPIVDASEGDGFCVGTSAAAGGKTGRESRGAIEIVGFIRAQEVELHKAEGDEFPDGLTQIRVRNSNGQRWGRNATTFGLSF